MRRLSIIALTTVLFARVAPAADLPAVYTVDEKLLKAAVSGTMLTFDVYSDSTCTTLVDSAAVTIDNVTVRQRIKQSKVKGGTPAPKVVDLRYTIPGTTATGNVYLKVTGTGVTAVGATCQAQAAAIVGGGGAVVKDGIGTLMGASLDGASFLAQIGPDLVRFPVDASGYRYDYNVLYFGSAGCSGQTYSNTSASAGLYQPAYPVNGTQYYVPPASALSTLPFNSYLHVQVSFASQSDCDTFYGLGVAVFTPPHGCCLTNSNSGPLVPVSLQTLPTFTAPFQLVLP